MDRELVVDFSTKVRRVVRAGLITGQCSADQTAGLFTIQRRTLSRRLRAEGTTFEALLAEIRYEAARHARVTMVHHESAAGGERLSGANPEKLSNATVKNEDSLGIFTYDPVTVALPD